MKRFFFQKLCKLENRFESIEKKIESLNQQQSLIQQQLNLILMATLTNKLGTSNDNNK